MKWLLMLATDTEVRNPPCSDKQWAADTNTAAPVVKTWPVWEFYEVDATRP